MRRRAFLAWLGGAAVWPLAARAQQPMPVIGFLHSATSETSASFVAGLKRGLKEEGGFVEGQNVAIEYRWAQGLYERLPALADAFVRRPVSLIVAGGGPPSALAAKAATSTIPIVFTSGSDPVKLGIVESLNRPSGNLTGVVFFNSALVAKRLELLRELAPSASAIGFLTNPRNPEAEPEIKDAREAARALGLDLQILSAGDERDIQMLFAESECARSFGARDGLRSDPGQPARSSGGSRGSPRGARDQQYSRVRRSGRPCQLRNQHLSSLSRSRGVCGPNSQRHQASGVASRAADQVRAGDQPQDSTGARP